MTFVQLNHEMALSCVPACFHRNQAIEREWHFIIRYLREGACLTAKRLSNVFAYSEADKERIADVSSSA